MKKPLLLLLSLQFFVVSAQDHLSGINTSKRIGLLNVSNNPAELSNLSSKYEVNLFSVSTIVSNNIVGFNDIVDGENLEDLLFKGEKPVNFRLDSEIYGPGFAMRLKKWSFGFNTKGYIKASVVDVNPSLGDAILNQAIQSIGGEPTKIKNDYNQRLNGTTWGEVGLSVARNLYATDTKKFSAGVTLKLLFPGSYANFGVSQFTGTITNNTTEQTIRNATANVNFAYSGNLANSFVDFSDYSKSVFGGLSGYAADFGINYQWKNKDKEEYKLNIGAAVKNIGSMTFKSDNNSSINYDLKIPRLPLPNTQFLDLNKFTNIESLQEIEKLLINEGFLTKTDGGNANFKVNLPTVFSGYADIKVISKFYLTLYTQQKLNDNGKNDQIITQNVVSVTPRFSFKNYELFSSWADNEISGTTGGFGLRICGFYLGSSSILTALTSDTKQADFYIGFQYGLR
ncbi:DUF5723 family protein [Flavobacterium luteum]|uniref:DUF5723 domain-containing protein n=1 Tax=Flavobacterium luteum TaxID=2026654 RepID=A0A7J5AIW9_9FLAO|nr:DUF5723 family protein [Flavobacterium luteum]KAB1157557.1 hypothetical protein F6464_00280 [Flavobacterium luteum]